MSVYRIYDINEPKQFYIGSCKDFKKRKIDHRNRCKIDNQKFYQYIRNNGGWDNFKMELLEYCLEYQEREIELIKTLKPPLNSYVYNFNKKEYIKEYHQQNRDKLNQKSKKRYELNKDELLEKAKIYHAYKSSWGGDQRSNNNLLKIDIKIFD